MKKILSLAVSILSAVLFLGQIGAAPLSPALEIISASRPMKLSVTSTSDKPSGDDIKTSMGLGEDDILTLVSLPEGGTLKYGASNLCLNQDVPASAADFITYTGDSSSFVFRVNDSYDVKCFIEKNDIINVPPTATGAASEVFTYNNTSFFGYLGGSDSDSGEVSFEIEKYPSKGVVSILDRTGGKFCYMPYENCSGDDSFSYRVRDGRGGYSEPCEVKCRIEKNRDCIFSDLGDCESSPYAVRAVKAGYMDASYGGGLLSFEPERPVTKEEFCVAVMKLFGADNIPELDSSVFADCSDIREENRQIVTAAYLLGFADCEKHDAKLCFEPRASVSFEEAALIIGNITGVDDVQYVMAGDEGLLDPWARPAVMKLCAAGAADSSSMKNCALSDCLTRAQCAELLCNVADIAKK